MRVTLDGTPITRPLSHWPTLPATPAPHPHITTTTGGGAHGGGQRSLWTTRCTQGMEITSTRAAKTESSRWTLHTWPNPMNPMEGFPSKPLPLTPSPSLQPPWLQVIPHSAHILCRDPWHPSSLHPCLHTGVHRFGSYAISVHF